MSRRASWGVAEWGNSGWGMDGDAGGITESSKEQLVLVVIGATDHFIASDTAKGQVVLAVSGTADSGIFASSAGQLVLAITSQSASCIFLNPEAAQVVLATLGEADIKVYPELLLGVVALVVTELTANEQWIMGESVGQVALAVEGVVDQGSFTESRSQLVLAVAGVLDNTVFLEPVKEQLILAVTYGMAGYVNCEPVCDQVILAITALAATEQWIMVETSRNIVRVVQAVSNNVIFLQPEIEQLVLVKTYAIEVERTGQIILAIIGETDNYTPKFVYNEIGKGQVILAVSGVVDNHTMLCTAKAQIVLAVASATEQLIKVETLGQVVLAVASCTDNAIFFQSTLQGALVLVQMGEADYSGGYQELDKGQVILAKSAVIDQIIRGEVLGTLVLAQTGQSDAVVYTSLLHEVLVLAVMGVDTGVSTYQELGKEQLVLAVSGDTSNTIFVETRGQIVLAEIGQTNIGEFHSLNLGQIVLVVAVGSDARNLITEDVGQVVLAKDGILDKAIFDDTQTEQLVLAILSQTSICEFHSLDLSQIILAITGISGTGFYGLQATSYMRAGSLAEAYTRTVNPSVAYTRKGTQNTGYPI